MSASASHGKHSFKEVPAYNKWVKERDVALERLHTNAQLQQSDIMRKVISDSLITAKGFYLKLKEHDTIAVDSFETHLKPIFSNAVQQLYYTLSVLRRNAYVLAKAGESEIIARLLKRTVRASVTRQDISRIQMAPTMAGGSAQHRIKLYMDRLRRVVASSAQSSALNAKNGNDFVIDVLQSFPHARPANQPRRVLKFGEADNNISPTVGTAVDLIDDQAWGDMLDDYKNAYVPKWRAPEYIADLPTKEGDTWYAWEFERDLTNEFVKAVRTGTVDAATENGITDFEWIAVVDNETDQCCLWRDGLLTSEIEDKASAHEDDDADCDDDTTPPIHFNCRCTVAPATDDMPEKPDDGGLQFDNWLLS